MRAAGGSSRSIPDGIETPTRGSCLLRSKELDAIAEIERELFVSVTGDSDVEIEEELFVSSPLPSASEIPSIPLLAEPSLVPAQTKAMEVPIARGMIAQIATTIGAPTQPDGEAPSVMPARPISRSMPRPLSSLQCNGVTPQAYRTGRDRHCRPRALRPRFFPLCRSSPITARREQLPPRAPLQA